MKKRHLEKKKMTKSVALRSAYSMHAHRNTDRLTLLPAVLQSNQGIISQYLPTTYPHVLPLSAVLTTHHNQPVYTMCWIYTRLQPQINLNSYESVAALQFTVFTRLMYPLFLQRSVLQFGWTVHYKRKKKSCSVFLCVSQNFVHPPAPPRQPACSSMHRQQKYAVSCVCAAGIQHHLL